MDSNNSTTPVAAQGASYSVIISLIFFIASIVCCVLLLYKYFSPATELPLSGDSYFILAVVTFFVSYGIFAWTQPKDSKKGLGSYVSMLMMCCGDNKPTISGESSSYIIPSV